ncbi:NUDIX hydrolase [Prolixibacter sp. SD074]|uniref:NUDIX hydrolase n=1 Tax=Prolixibacter sp. SD074 TaxID=2652391 RepID=UPI001276E45A|nr:NUDIX hydrolase [Prolixibacter sp. SD074]GET27948.1 DNA mismatch repair protein MutT [Prolixibacter sp. SD074]
MNIIPSLSIDCVIFGFHEKKLKVLLLEYDKEQLDAPIKNPDAFAPYAETEPDGKFPYEKPIGLPGGHVPVDRSINDFARDILETATGIKDIYLKQLGAFGETERVSFLRVVSVVYYALINPEHYNIRGSSLLKSLEWYDIDKVPELIFDHNAMVEKALKRLREEVQIRPVGFHLLPEMFTLTQLQQLYETVLGIELDTRNFRKKIQKMHLVVDTGKMQTGVAHRAARLFRFDEKVYEMLAEQSFSFRV